MTSIGQKERETQNRVLQLFKDQLKYAYLGNWEDREDNSNIEQQLLRKYLLRKGYSENLISKAIYELVKAAGDQNKKLYYFNQDVFLMLRYGVKVRP